MTKKNDQFKLRMQKIINSGWFNAGMVGVIIINGILIGAQTYNNHSDMIHYLQFFILFIFFIEITLRWLGRNSTKEYLSDPWNYFDFFILLIGIVPEVADIMMNQADGERKSSVLATLRVLRIVQLTRSIRAVEELRILIGVLIKSIKSLSYIAVLFLLIMYIYAIMGVTLFKNPNYEQSEHLHLTGSNPDPYEDLGEAFFTLFRILTGEDWTDLVYNLLDNEYTTRVDENGVKHTVPTGVNNTVVTFYHVSWMVIAAYLLMNLVVGAIVNNFQLVLDDQKALENKSNQNRIIKRPKI